MEMIHIECCVDVGDTRSAHLYLNHTVLNKLTSSYCVKQTYIIILC